MDDAFIMIMHCHAEYLLCLSLADDMLVQNGSDVRRFWYNEALWLIGLLSVLFIQDVFTHPNAAVTNEDPRSSDELSHLGMTFTAKRAEGDSGGAWHGGSCNLARGSSYRQDKTSRETFSRRNPWMCSTLPLLFHE